MDSNPWNIATSNLSAVGSVLTGIDPKKAQLESAKKALSVLLKNDPDNKLIEISLVAANGDIEELQKLLTDPSNLEYLAQADFNGLYPLTYAIVSNNEKITELLLSKSSTVLNEPDSLIGYTPLMWATYLGEKGIVVELLNHGAKLEAKGKNGITVWDLIRPDDEMYEFFEEHGLLERKESTGFDSETDDDSNQSNIRTSYTNGNDENVIDDGWYKSGKVQDELRAEDDELLNKIKLQTAGLVLSESASTGNRGIYQDDGDFLTRDSVFQEDFNFNKLIKNQFIIFSDYDIPSILEFIFNLNKKYNHQTTYPAAVIYQATRYANHIKENDILVENFLNLVFTKIRSNTSSKTGITSVYQEGDIVLQSYWVSVLNFLYFYLCKDDGFFKKYPKVLQELITTLNSLIIELTNSIKFRLNSMIDGCLLEFTNIPDLTSTLYKNDWNFFKKKHQPKSTYDEIYQMLYPPSIKDQIKPSPIKIVQTLGALLYVLDLHHVHPLVTQQSLSIVFQWLSFSLFNRILSQKKYLSRNKAIQIRLNLSVLEDWARSNNRHPKLPEGIDDDYLKSFPNNLVEGDNHQRLINLHNVLTFKGNSRYPADLSFYHNNLFTIVKFQMEPLYELLQWLQLFTSIKEETNLVEILKDLEHLNSIQIVRIISKYRYELDEEKFPKLLEKKMKHKVKEEEQEIPRVRYMNSEYLYLNADFSYPVALPTIMELVDEYGAGLGGINKSRALKFQPFLPYEVTDELDEIHEQKLKEIEHGDKAGDQDGYEEDPEDNENEDGEDGNGNGNGEEENNEHENEMYKDNNISAKIEHTETGIFGELAPPASLAHRNWGEEDVNPW